MAAPHNAWRIRHFRQEVASFVGALAAPVANPVSGGAISRHRMEQWADWTVTTANSPVVQIYLEMIVHYVNTHYGLLGPGAPPNAIQDIVLMPANEYELMLDEPCGHILAAIDLRDAGVTRARFPLTQYIFLPMNYGTHRALAVISPIDHTVEILDSISGAWGPNRSTHIYAAIFEMIEYILGAAAFVPAQWRTLHTESPQQPVGGGNQDLRNCGVFVCKNAMAIACRQALGSRTYDHWHLQHERCRIGAEVMNGVFTGVNGRFPALLNTHPIRAHPGANRAVFKPWRPLSPQVLTVQARRWQAGRANKNWIKLRCVAINRARGHRWMLGHVQWGGPGQTRDQYFRAVEQRLDNIYRGLYIP